MLRAVLIGAGGLLLCISGACDSRDSNFDPDRNIGRQTEAASRIGDVSDGCADAFAAAAVVSSYEDTHQDLFPAYSSCGSTDEWRAASEMFPNAIEDVDPVRYAMTVCAGNQQELGGTRICQAVNAPDHSAGVILSRSERSGLLGVPLPRGAELIESTPGDASAARDPAERYSVSATASEIAAFYDREMHDAGWLKGGMSTGNALFFERGRQGIVVLINDDGGTFTLMGS